MEVPGAAKEDVEVKDGPTAGTILVRVQPRKGNASKETGTLLRSERHLRDGNVEFERVLPVAWDADTSKVTTRVTAGLLEVTVPKRRGTESGTAASEKKK